MRSECEYGRQTMPQRAAVRRGVALIGAVTVFGLAPPGSPMAQPGAGITAQVVDGVLTITGEPGVSGDVTVQYHAMSLFHGATYTVDLLGREERTGPGCEVVAGGTTYCRAAGIQRIAADLGDGSDTMSFGRNVTPAPDPIPVPIGVTLGPGDDEFGNLMAAGQPVTVDGGPGDDGIQVGDSEPGDAPSGASEAHLRGGDGNDLVVAYDVPRLVGLEGGDGDDELGAGDIGAPGFTVAAGPGRDQLNVSGALRGDVTLLGEAGDDSLGAAVVSGDPALTLVGGEGDDRFREDPELSSSHRLRTVTRAGAGDDTIWAIPDRDRDLVDCGPGRDTLQSGVEGVAVPAGNDYVDCPPVGVRIDRRGRIAGRVASVGVATRVAVRLSARLLRSSDLRPLARVRALRVRRHATIRFRLGPAGVRGSSRRLVVAVKATSPSGDLAAIRRKVNFATDRPG